MKKIICSLSIALMLGLASCGNAIDSKIDKLADIKEKMEKLQEENPFDAETQQKIVELTGEALKITSELAKEQDKMTDAQKERLQELFQ